MPQIYATSQSAGHIWHCLYDSYSVNMANGISQGPNLLTFARCCYLYFHDNCGRSRTDDDKGKLHHFSRERCQSNCRVAREATSPLHGHKTLTSPFTATFRYPELDSTRISCSALARKRSNNKQQIHKIASLVFVTDNSR